MHMPHPTTIEQVYQIYIPTVESVSPTLTPRRVGTLALTLLPGSNLVGALFTIVTSLYVGDGTLLHLSPVAAFILI